MDISKETQESLAISGFLRYDKENAAENLPINHELLRGTTVSPWGKRIIMEKITSFTIDHIKLQPGVYVSRKDIMGGQMVTTFDLRLTSPNEEPVMNTAEMHTMEHLAATYLRNEPNWKEQVLYFGPMGCRTGFYLLLWGDRSSREVLPLVRDCFAFIRDFRGEVPGASAKDCGNYLDMNLPMANYWGAKYAALLENITEDRLVYPE